MDSRVVEPADVLQADRGVVPDHGVVRCKLYHRVILGKSPRVPVKLLQRGSQLKAKLNSSRRKRDRLAELEVGGLKLSPAFVYSAEEAVGRWGGWVSAESCFEGGDGPGRVALVMVEHVKVDEALCGFVPAVALVNRVESQGKRGKDEREPTGQSAWES